MGTDYRSLYGKEWIGAWDLQDRDVTVTIAKVEGGELTSVGGRKSKKPVVHIKGTDKKLALNATNGKTIAGLYGKMIEEWVGKRITLYKAVTRDPSGDGEVECVRIRPKVPQQKPKEGGDSSDNGTVPVSTTAPAPEQPAGGGRDAAMAQIRETLGT